MNDAKDNGTVQLPPGSHRVRIFNILLGLFWIVVTYELILNQRGAPSMLAGLLGGLATALCVWVWRLRDGNSKWWFTATISGGGAMLVTTFFHLLPGGDYPAIAAILGSSFGLETGLYAAFGPAATLHLLSSGFGWGTPRVKEIPPEPEVRV